MVTLHAYILRELLKTFALAVIALAGLFTMAGGLVTVIRYEGITAANLVVVVPLLLPIVVTLTMPVAALFAAAMVYGRLAADNELLACRAAGVNVHRLFLAAMLLAVFVTAFALFSGNFIIPDFLLRLERFARNNLRDIAFAQLHGKGNLRLRDEFFLSAERVENVAHSELERKGFPTGPGMGYMLITAPTFLQLNKSGEVVRFTTAEAGLCRFDTRQQEVNLTIALRNANDYEVDQSQGTFKADVTVSVEPRRRTPLKPSLVDLGKLLTWRARPWEADTVRPEVQAFAQRFAYDRFYAHACQRINAGQALELSDEDGGRYALTAGRCVWGDNGLRLEEPRVVAHDPRLERPILYRAAQGELRAEPAGDRPGRLQLALQQTPAQPVLVQHPRAADYQRPREHGTQRLGDLLIPDAIVAAAAYTPDLLTDLAQPLPMSERLTAARRDLAGKCAQMRRDAAAIIHFRLGYPASALVTVLMGAVLGVIYRGAQPLAAFGLACIPFGVVTVLVIMGRSLAEKSATELLGVSIIWGGLAAMAAADGLFVWLGVRR